MTTNELLQALHLDGDYANGLTSVTVPREYFAEVATGITEHHGLRLALLYATDDRDAGKGFGVHAVFDLPVSHEWLRVSIELPAEDPTYTSLTKTIMAAHWYERFAMDQFGIVAIGHPDPRRLVHHENVPEGMHPLRKDFAWDTKMEHANVSYPLHRVEGEGVYEIPVGPIHAGIIEPGHFRFNVAGERIMTLEGKLFFTHKGVEKLLEGKTPEEALPFIERLSGDMAVAHALAFCQAVESIAGIQIPDRAKRLRSMLLECERITMHIHDLSNICGMGTGFTVMAAQGFRIKERLMRLSEEVCGNRFWRGLVVPGGSARDLSHEILEKISTTIIEVNHEMQELLLMGRRQDGLRERLETTGVLKRDAAEAYGALGLPARASGVDVDVRRDHPFAAYDAVPPEVVTLETGDVYARFKLRYRELDLSTEIVTELISEMEDGAVRVVCEVGDGVALGAVESWRGEILTALHLKNSRIIRCFPRDPSFCNWALFGELGPGNIVPDFPLCNKSLNLSYSGTDM